ncbi:ribosome-inactivating family protein [Spiroplasma endosymbiont of Megaselia nigra]|uniref:ribosome-inactivating family protein n=1 Tax=Spiroplasma endosymbiont of Megaselia nigra TaxID=2478537 RepID=UPI000F882161|nr:ribosome-inactivating family protein [Spiroplasma endosymbiont of Megaselia nigra]RUO86470.1 hypothetical protein D9R21_02895 [Spiroplasma endosymbiont of Megaselia nigra]
MKKLLSLLSVLTISGISMPSVIAANPYQKEKNKLENIVDNKKFNTNNLENLNRVKRGKPVNKKTTTKKKPTVGNSSSETESNNNISSSSINNKNKFHNLNEIRKESINRIRNKIKNHCLFKSGHESTVNNNRQYKNFLRESINYFQETENIEHETKHPSTEKSIFKLKINNVNKDDIIPNFIPLKTIKEQETLVPHSSTQKVGEQEIEINVNQENRNRRRTIPEAEIELVLNSSNLYLDGFITTENVKVTPNINKNKEIKSSEYETNILKKKTYWYFNDSSEKIKSQIEDKFNKEKEENKIKEFESKSLDYSGNYSTLIGNKDIEINKNNILSSINKISNTTLENKNEIKDDLVRVIFMTSESMRFFSIREKVDSVLNNDESINWRNYKDTLNNWNTYSQNYYKMKTGTEFTDEEKQKIYDVSILLPSENEEIFQTSRATG